MLGPLRKQHGTYILIRWRERHHSLAIVMVYQLVASSSGLCRGFSVATESEENNERSTEVVSSPSLSVGLSRMATDGRVVPTTQLRGDSLAALGVLQIYN